MRLGGTGTFFANTTRIAARCGHCLCGLAYRIIGHCAADLTEGALRTTPTPHRDEPD